MRRHGNVSAVSLGVTMITRPRVDPMVPLIVLKRHGLVELPSRVVHEHDPERSTG
jgi:hypothetical protein